MISNEDLQKLQKEALKSSLVKELLDEYIRITSHPGLKFYTSCVNIMDMLSDELDTLNRNDSEILSSSRGKDNERFERILKVLEKGPKILSDLDAVRKQMDSTGEAQPSAKPAVKGPRSLGTA